MDKAKAIFVASRLDILFHAAAMVPLPELKEARDHLEEEVGRYEAIGFMDPGRYERSLADMRARLERIEAVVNLLEVFGKTQGEISGRGMDTVGKMARRIKSRAEA